MTRTRYLRVGRKLRKPDLDVVREEVRPSKIIFGTYTGRLGGVSRKVFLHKPGPSRRNPVASVTFSSMSSLTKPELQELKACIERALEEM